MIDFEEVYRDYLEDVYRFSLALCRDPVLAEELTQETFFRALEHIGQFRGECTLRVWLLVFRFQRPIPYSQDIRIQEVEPAFHMEYLGRDHAGLEVLFRVTEEGGETIRRVYLCYTGSLWTRYLSPGSPYHESVGINNGIVLDTRHGTVIPLPFDGGADQVWYLAGDLEELEDLDEASFQAQAGDAVLLWERQG